MKESLIFFYLEHIPLKRIAIRISITQIRYIPTSPGT
jgi:hypothetical protein